MSNQLSSPTTTSSLSQSPQQTPTNKPEMRMHQTQRRAQHRANRFGASFALLLLANATLLLALTLTANADNYNAQQQIQQQPTDGYAGPQQANNGNSYNGNEQQQQQQQPTKAKKIQIVYIKVPLAKLKSSPMHSADLFSSNNQSSNYGTKGDSSSPSSMLSSPSSMNQQQQQQHQTDNNNSKRGIQAPTAGNNQGPYGGGNAGTSGDQGTLPGTSSGASYTGSGPGQLDMHSLEKGLQQSGSAYANSGPSLGFGSGINSFGASVAFSDYPTNSGQQTYAQSPLSSSSSNSNNHQLSHSQDSSSKGYESQKLRQAKKTIIPIVVQVEHAVLENNGAPLAGSNQFKGGNKYGQQQPQSNSLRSHRQMSASNGKRHRGAKQAGGEYRQNGNQVPYGANSNMNEINLAGPSVDALNTGSGAQYINAANAQDINQITAAINAENAASAAAALAQADMAFGNGQAFMQQGRYNGNGNHQQQGFMRPQSQYAAGLQSAASALLSNTHPVIQAAASGGLASVSKLGAKLGEIIALPSMQVPNSIAALPSALSSITSQMAVQMNQAVQQVAKEHPTAHAFARQVAQHAGINLPNFAQAQMQPQQHQQQHNQHHQTNQMSNQQAAGQQVSAAASDQHNSIAASSPQAQLQNLKLSIGQNLQTAAAQLIGAHQKANAASSAASLLANPLAALYPQAMNAALKQLSSGMSPLVTGNNVAFAPSSLHQQQQQQSQNQNLNGEVNHMMHFQQGQQVAPQAGVSPPPASTSQQLVSSASESSGIVKPTKSSSLKSKFLAFFQPPKFISNMLSWNDRAGARSDKGPIVEKAADIEAAKALVDQTIKSSNATSTTVGSSSTAITSAPIMVSSTTLAARSNSSAGPGEEVKLAKPEASSSNKTMVSV